MTTSPNASFAVGPGANVTDAQGNVFAINLAGQITVNGVVDATTGRVDALGYYNGQVWQKNADNYWYSKAAAGDTWANVPFTDSAPIPVPPASADNTVITASFVPITDGNGNQWSIEGGQVATDGVVDTTTGRVIQLDYVAGVIWQENIDGNWYSKTTPSDTWTQATNIDPIAGQPVATEIESWTGAVNKDAGNAGNWSQYHLPVAGEPLNMSAGTMDLGGGNLAGDTLAIQFSDAKAPPVINLTKGGNLKLDAGVGTAKVNISGGQATLDIKASYGGSVIVTADRLSSGLLHANMSFASLTVNGGTILLNGDSLFDGTSVLLNGNLAGSGTAMLPNAPSRTSHIEVTGSVGSGVTINAAANFGLSGSGSVVLDSPKLDHGKVVLTDSYLELKIGAGTVIDSVSYKNDMLTLFSGNMKFATVEVVGIKGPGFSRTGYPNTGILEFARSAAGNVYAYNNDPANLYAGALTPLAVHV